MHIPRGSFPRAGANFARNVVNGLNIDPKVPAPTITSSTVSATSAVPSTTTTTTRPAPPVGQVPASAPSATYSYMTTSSSIATPTNPAPIFGSPIQQGPAPSASPAATNAAAHNRSKVPKSALPIGATAGILVVSVLALLAFGLCLYRMWSIRKRKKLRDWWVPEPFLESKTKKALGGGVTEKAQQQEVAVRTIPRVRPPSVPLPPVPAGSASESAAGMPDSVSAYGANAAPPMPPLPVAYQKAPLRRTSSIGPTAPAPIYSPQRGVRAGNIGVVKSIFEPRMQDELRIRVGEALRVLAEYDDGWAFCETARGERGMIPLECLDRGNTARVRARSLVGSGESLAVQLGRRSARKSSLPPKRTQA